MAEQMPYHHPSQLKLVDLLEQLGKSTKLVVCCPGISIFEILMIINDFQGIRMGRYYRYLRLGESLREFLTSESGYAYSSLLGICKRHDSS